jgi:integrase
VVNAIKRIEPFWGNRFPHEINRDNLAEWYAWLDREYPGEQKENPIKYMRNFCRYLAEKVVNGVPLLPAVPKITDPNRKDIKAARQQRKQLIISSADFKKIYQAGNDTEKLLALFMYTMAPRIDETLNFKFGEQIMLDGETPLYRWSIGQNKADHWGQHALHPALIEPLIELRKKRISEGTSLLFPQKIDNKKALRPQQIEWDLWRQRSDIGWHWTAHTFRHTCLSNLFNDEKNPQALICKLYRVSLAVALDTYIKPTKSGIEKMRTAIEVSL